MPSTQNKLIDWSLPKHLLKLETRMVDEGWTASGLNIAFISPVLEDGGVEVMISPMFSSRKILRFDAMGRHANYRITAITPRKVPDGVTLTSYSQASAVRNSEAHIFVDGRLAGYLSARGNIDDHYSRYPARDVTGWTIPITHLVNEAWKEEDLIQFSKRIREFWKQQAEDEKRRKEKLEWRDAETGSNILDIFTSGAMNPQVSRLFEEDYSINRIGDGRNSYHYNDPYYTARWENPPLRYPTSIIRTRRD